jgi:hypothetical protein
MGQHALVDILISTLPKPKFDVNAEFKYAYSMPQTIFQRNNKKPVTADVGCLRLSKSCGT